MSRPRGFESWKPQRRTQAKLDAVQDVLIEYADYLPITIRQAYYRLVGKVVIGKTENDYENLCEMLNRARRSCVISMSAFRDDGFHGGYGTRLGFVGVDEFKYSIIQQAKNYRTDRQAGQNQRLVLWCEAVGMIGQLESVGNIYGVSVKSSGGFDSLTAKHGAGENFGGHTILHVGDYDPSGECMFDALKEDVRAFGWEYENDIVIERIAITPEQIKRFNLPTAPPKKSSHQKKKQMLETVQVEALTPTQLADIVRDAIESRMDMDVYRQAVKAEKQQRKKAVEWLGGLT